jgi:hypothetical protein
MMSFSRGAIAGYMALVFVSGVAVGGFGHSLYTVSPVFSKVAGNPPPPPSPEEFRKRFVGDAKTRLKLSDDQVMKLNLILDESRGRFHEVRAKEKPELDAIRKNQRESIMTMLTPEQREEYDRWRKEVQEDSKRNGTKPGPGF